MGPSSPAGTITADDSNRQLFNEQRIAAFARKYHLRPKPLIQHWVELDK